MRRHTSQRVLVVCSLLGAGVAACSGSTDVANGEAIGATSSAITANDAILRAEEWVAVKLPYCQSANHQPDGDNACDPICTRPDNPAWDDYRSDCSGLVSWAWGLPAPGRVTWELAPAMTDITSTVPAATLQPGDAVNKPHHHTMLFKAWIVPGKRATFIEEPGCSSSTPYAHELDSDVTISGTSITVSDNGITFDAIHYEKLQPSVDAGAPDTGAAPDAPDAATHDARASDAPSAPPEPADDAGTAPDVGAAQSDYFTPRENRGCTTSRAGGSNAFLALPLCAFLVFRRRRAPIA
jgi:hypothetical protein